MLKNNSGNINPLIRLDNHLNYNYSYLIQHSTRNNCEENYKKCGILDTMGNIMCVPESE